MFSTDYWKKRVCENIAQISLTGNLTFQKFHYNIFKQELFAKIKLDENELDYLQSFLDVKLDLSHEGMKREKEWIYNLKNKYGGIYSALELEECIEVKMYLSLRGKSHYFLLYYTTGGVYVILVTEYDMTHTLYIIGI